jgi:enamine deaminase RidA (YjgF/YER057c/UK114 family)
MTDETIHVLQPADWPRPKGYSHGMAGRGRIVVVAGQVGRDNTGVFRSSTTAGQAKQALENIVAVLAAGGAKPEHILRMNWYVTHLDEYRSQRAEIGAHYRAIIGKHFPAMTLVQVAGLLERDARVEIEALAVVPE